MSIWIETFLFFFFFFGMKHRRNSSVRPPSVPISHLHYILLYNYPSLAEFEVTLIIKQEGYNMHLSYFFDRWNLSCNIMMQSKYSTTLSSWDVLADNDMSPKGQYTVITNLCASTNKKTHTCHVFFPAYFWQLPSAPSATSPFIWQQHHTWLKGGLHQHSFHRSKHLHLPIPPTPHTYPVWSLPSIPLFNPHFSLGLHQMKCK